MSAGTRMRLLIVDDHEIVRAGVRMMVESNDAIEVVGEASTGEEGVRRAQALLPDVVLMDVDMPVMNGVDAARRIRELVPSARVLMLTVHEDDEMIFDAVRAGASGYVPKGAGPTELDAALTALGQGGAYMTPVAADKAIRCLTRKVDTAQEALRAADVTTAREREILELLARGMSAREVASELGISERTVNTHVGHIYRSLGVNNRVDAIRTGMRLGLVDMP